MLITRRRGQRGFTILCILMALVIVGILTQNYLGPSVPGGKSFAQIQQDRAHAAVNAINLRNAQTDFFMKSEGRQMAPDELRRAMDDLSIRMGGGGRYFVDASQNVQVTTMLQTPKFRERMGNLPTIR